MPRLSSNRPSLTPPVSRRRTLGALATEKRHADSEIFDKLSTREILHVINAADAEVAGAVKREIPRIGAAIDAIVTALESGGSLFYIGAGTSGRLGVLDASECPPTFGVPAELVRGLIAGGPDALTHAIEGAEDDPVQGATDVRAAGVQKGDAVVGIAASGRTPYVIGAIGRARQLGAVTCSLSCVPKALLSSAADWPIEVVTGPEVISGSTRMRAGTATKMVLNMISTAVMVRLGYVYGNLMVNVRPTNQKLMDRAQRIVMQAAGVDAAQATELLNQAGRNIRVAIVMHCKSVDRTKAELLLNAANGRLREVLETS